MVFRTHQHQTESFRVFKRSDRWIKRKMASYYGIYFILHFAILPLKIIPIPNVGKILVHVNECSQHQCLSICLEVGLLTLHALAYTSMEKYLEAITGMHTSQKQTAKAFWILLGSVRALIEFICCLQCPFCSLCYRC